MEIGEFKERLGECKGAVFSLDNTLVYGRVTDALMLQIFGTLQGKRMGIDGLRYFVNAAGRTGCVTRDALYRGASEYIRGNSIPGAREFLQYLGERNITPFISTPGLELCADAAANVFGYDLECIGNRITTTSGGSVTGLAEPPLISDPHSRVTQTAIMLLDEENKQSLCLNDCVGVGAYPSDWPIMSVSKISVASPMAAEEVIARADIWIRDYSRFLDELRA